jgi:hypothetical protein
MVQDAYHMRAGPCILFTYLYNPCTQWQHRAYHVEFFSFAALIIHFSTPDVANE